MINGFSKFAVLYLAPLLMLTALFLSLFAFLAPSAMLHDRVALLTVTPSTALTNPQAQANDGPSVFLGALGPLSYILLISKYSHLSQALVLVTTTLAMSTAPLPPFRLNMVRRRLRFSHLYPLIIPH